MATHSQSYLTCDKCGELLKDEQGATLYGETGDCVRAEAYDLGWQCNIDDHEDLPDLCPDCRRKKEKGQ